jgi:hypothetical protein
MTEDIERLISAAERVSRVWRRGTDKASDTMRDAINELDWMVSDIKKRAGKESTRVIERSDIRIDMAGG